MHELPAVALAALLASPALAPVAPGRLPIINDDFVRARTEARQRHVPVFVEVWAPW